MGTESKVAELLLKSGAVILRPQKPFKFSSGILSRSMIPKYRKLF